MFCEILVSSKPKISLKSIYNLLHLLQRIQFFVSRSQQVITVLLSQVCAILGKTFYSATTSFPVSFLHLFESCFILRYISGTIRVPFRIVSVSVNS